MTTNYESNDKVVDKLDSIKVLLENLFILEATKSNMNKKQIRKILKIAMSRVNKVSKEIKA